MKNQYKVTKDLMMSWAKEYDLHSQVNKRGMVLSCLLALLGVGLLVNLLINGGEWLYWYFAFLFIGLAVFRLFVARRLAWSKRYQIYSATYGVSEWLRTTEFTDEDIVLTDHTSVSHLRYERIEAIKENGNVVMLYLNDNMAIRLYIDAFVEGTWAECKDIILAKMRK